MKPTLAAHADHAPQPDTHVARAQEWFLEGNRKWNEEDIHGALECFMKSVESDATGDAFYNIANCHLQLGNYLDAQTAWEKSIELSPKRADAHVNLANVYALVLKDTAKALPLYEEALRLEPTDGDIRFNYAAVLDSAGQLEKAIEQYKLAIDNGCKVAEKNLRNALARQLGKHLKESEGSDK
ncbi:hypothetical protein PhCBS80983_g02769 [Powellomyces hirtus]|uniref:Uncharacterized protein n=1 Tax=Powellomyces hirtus TaxID=109895 RepID=A0A507E7B1_9FUNG|nr:hypothetical protein PhCBS80983_g02769 [Powellomyces hirtus]